MKQEVCNIIIQMEAFCNSFNKCNRRNALFQQGRMTWSLVVVPGTHRMRFHSFFCSDLISGSASKYFLSTGLTRKCSIAPTPASPAMVYMVLL